jgi:hypothetical protein
MEEIMPQANLIYVIQLGKTLEQDVTKLTELMFIIGSVADGLTEANAKAMAEAVHLISNKNTTAPITLSIHGFDDDPRELWEIPETQYYISIFALELHRLGLPPNFVKRLTPESLKWATVAI